MHQVATVQEGEGTGHLINIVALFLSTIVKLSKTHKFIITLHGHCSSTPLSYVLPALTNAQGKVFRAPKKDFHADG